MPQILAHFTTKAPGRKEEFFDTDLHFNKPECECRAEPRKRETTKSAAPPEKRVAAICFSA
jgi:hypothetical protein